MNPADSLPLRDIHLPESVSWWPPAIGWWLVLVSMILLFVLARFIIWAIRQRALKKSAKAEIAKVIANYKFDSDKAGLVQGLSIAFRRIGMSYLGRNQCGGLHGPEWYEQLNLLVPQNRLSDDAIRLLSVSPYQKVPQFDSGAIDSLMDAASKWVAGLPTKPSKNNESRAKASV